MEKQGSKEHARQRKKQIAYKNNLRKRVEYTQGKLGLGYIVDEGTKRERVKTYGLSSPYLKNICNRKLRRDNENIYQRGEYKKVHEYWWELI